jgi:hypothetical protein
MSTGKIILLIVGILFLLASIPLLFGGGGLLWVNAVLTDDNGFISTERGRLQSDSYAMATESFDIDIDRDDINRGWHWGWGWYADWDLGDLVTFKVEGKNNDTSEGIFIGVARESDLMSYLRNVEYDEITNISIHPDGLDVDYINHSGNSSPEVPTSQTFWVEAAYGTGIQTLEWELEKGTYSLVLMNEDGSINVDVDVAVGVKIPWLFGVGLGMVIGGTVALILGILMVIFALRGRRRPQQPEPTQPMHVIKEV